MGMPYDLIWLAVPAYFLFQFIALARCDRASRFAVGAPLLLMIPLVAYTIISLLQGNNLWPVPLLLISPLALLYVLLAFAKPREQMSA